MVPDFVVGTPEDDRLPADHASHETGGRSVCCREAPASKSVLTKLRTNKVSRIDNPFARRVTLCELVLLVVEA